MTTRLVQVAHVCLQLPTADTTLPFSRFWGIVRGQEGEGLNV